MGLSDFPWQFPMDFWLLQHSGLSLHLVLGGSGEAPADTAGSVVIGMPPNPWPPLLLNLSLPAPTVMRKRKLKDHRASMQWAGMELENGGLAGWKAGGDIKAGDDTQQVMTLW